jgi:hypothetical protein
MPKVRNRYDSSLVRLYALGKEALVLLGLGRLRKKRIDHRPSRTFLAQTTFTTTPERGILTKGPTSMYRSGYSGCGVEVARV